MILIAYVFVYRKLKQSRWNLVQCVLFSLYAAVYIVVFYNVFLIYFYILHFTVHV